MPHRISRELRAENKTIAAERIERLFELAERAFGEHPELADRYVQLAWRLATRYNIRLPSRLKRRFCRKCLAFLKPGASCRVRIRPSYVVVTCLRCNRHMRIPVDLEREKQK